MNISEILEKQKEFYLSGATLSLDFRLSMLKKLQNALRRYEGEIAAALYEDLGKSAYESYMCETGLALSELSHMIKNLRHYAKERTVASPLAQFASRSYVKPCPYGNVLILSTWNYPLLLSIDPLADAIAAGNTVVLKPSPYSPATNAVVEKIIAECFDSEYIAFVKGGRDVNTELLKQKFDMIFFTGSQRLGREVLRHAAENLTPAVLELGGKSPCIVDSSAKIKLAAKRIVFGKYLNCGQTCVAPDFIYCHESVKDELIKELGEQLKLQYGENPIANPDYGKIVSVKQYERLISLIDKTKIVIGGETDAEALRIAPTVMDNVTWDDAVMQDEIFGPILPVLTFSSYEELYSVLGERPNPLALYLFSENKENIAQVTSRLAYGGGCINDVVIHLATSNMGFGGVGASGMGSYHGKEGFKAFSHFKSIVDKKTWIDLPIRYQPYKHKIFDKMIHFFLK